MSTRLRSYSKLVDNNEQAELNVAGLLVAEGALVEPVLILRASDPAAVKAVVMYVNEAIDQDAEPGGIDYAKAKLQEFQRWAREYGTFRQLEAPYHKDYTNDRAKADAPKQAEPPKPQQAKTPGKRK